MNLYLDIDGVLLTTKNPTKADFADEFIEFVVNRFNCFWLTTHCKGDSEPAMKYLSKYFEKETITNLKKIKPTNWNTLKTEAIDFSSEFVWLEDNPMYSELAVLQRLNKSENLIVVSLNKKSELERIKNLLK
ncbi:MAG: hypothetical protein JXL97_01345 [Bacteroidales bacterium]|nr:hypothetical protein [Bacteroidales bacterium]